MNNQKKFLPTVVLSLFFFIHGAIYNFAPAASSLLTNILFQGLSKAQYGSLFITLGIGGACGAILNCYLAERKGSYSSFLLGICGYLIFFILMGTVLLSFVNVTVNTALIFATLFFLGMGFALLIPVLFQIICDLYPANREKAMLALSIPVILGAFFIATYFSQFPGTILISLAALFCVLYPLMDGLFQFTGKTHIENKTISLKKLWLIDGSMLFYALIDSLYIIWSLIYFTSIEAKLPLDPKISHSLLFLVIMISRLFFLMFLNKKSFQWLYIILPIVTFLYASVQFFLFREKNMLFFVFISGFIVAPLYPLITIAAVKYYPKRIVRVSAEITGVYLFMIGVATFSYGYLNISTIFSGLLALWAVMLTLFNSATIMTFRKRSYPLEQER